MLADRKYWNPLLETLSPDRIKALQLKKFQRIFKWTYEHSKFHRSLYDRVPIRPEDVRSHEDIRRVPTVEKSMMRDIQRKDPFPYGDALCVPLEEVSEFRQTSGHHRPARLPGRHLAGLGVVGRVLVLHPVGPGVPAVGSGVHPLWLQCLRRLLGGALRSREDRV